MIIRVIPKLLLILLNPIFTAKNNYNNNLILLEIEEELRFKTYKL